MAAILLDFKKPLKFLDDSIVNEPKARAEDPDVPIIMNTLLANNISQGTKGGMKYFNWAIDLYKEGQLTLDKTDRDDLKKTIGEMQVNLLVQGRLIQVIEEAEEAAKPKDTKKGTNQ